MPWHGKAGPKLTFEGCKISYICKRGKTIAGCHEHRPQSTKPRLRTRKLSSSTATTVAIEGVFTRKAGTAAPTPSRERIDADQL
eukprot:762958-Hanusia_phi.AAC.3